MSALPAQPGVALRGGVPVIFPQFAANGPLPKHGFARTQMWQLQQHTDDTATFVLHDTAATRALWPFAFALELTVALGGPTLTLTLRVSNLSAEAFTFTSALHTYLRVADLQHARVENLSGVRYRELGHDNTDPAPALDFPGEVDRVYFKAPPSVRLCEPGRVVEVRASGFPDVVVWNPGTTKAAALTDLEPGGERHFVCIEAACVGQPVCVNPTASWSGTQTLTVIGNS